MVDAKSKVQPWMILTKLYWTKAAAEKCYGTIQNAVNKPLLIDNLVPAVTIIGVIDDLSSNTDLPLVHLISYKTLIAHKKEYRYSEEWGIDQQ